MQNEELSLLVLRSSETMKTQKSLAHEIGCSVGKVNYVLKALIEKGLIKVENFATSKNKKHYKYLLTQSGVQEKISLTEKFIDRKKREYEELQTELDNMKKSKVQYNEVANV